MLGFTASVLISDSLDMKKKRQITVGLMTMLFALLPDFDLAIVFVELLNSGFQEISYGGGEFWDDSVKFHRGITHSLIFSFVSATIFSLVAYGDKHKKIGFASAGLVVLLSMIFLGWLRGITISFYMILGLIIATIARERNLDIRLVIISSFTGLITHPFGDVFTGPPPEMLAPLPFELVSDQLKLFQDSTLHFLSAFALELAIAWISIYTYLRLKDESIDIYLRPYVVLGVFYGLISPFVDPPTLTSADHFVVGILILSVAITLSRAFVFKYSGIWLGREVMKILLVSAVGTVTISFLSYVASYTIIIS